MMRELEQKSFIILIVFLFIIQIKFNPFLHATEPVELVRQSQTWLIERNPELAARKFAAGASDPITFFKLFPVMFYAELADPQSKLGRSQFENEKTSHMWIIGNLTLDSFAATKPPEGREVYGIVDYFHAGKGSYRLDFQKLAVFIALLGRKMGLDRFRLNELVEEYALAYLKKVLERGEPLQVNETVARRKKAYWVVEALRIAQNRRKSLFLRDVTVIGELNKRSFIRRGALSEPQVNLRGYFKEILKSYITFLIQKGAMSESQKYEFRYKDAVTFEDMSPELLGVNKYWVLVSGRTPSLEDDLVLELFEATSGAFTPYYDAGKFENPAFRMTEAYSRFMPPGFRFAGQARSSYGEIFFVKFHDHTETRAELDRIKKPEDLTIHARLLAEILATAHVRANPEFPDEMARLVPDELAIQDFQKETSWFASRFVIKVEEATRNLILKRSSSSLLN